MRVKPKKSHPWKAHCPEAFKKRSDAYWAFIGESVRDRLAKQVRKDNRGQRLMPV